MCTLTFQPEIESTSGNSRWIVFNRDELRSRPPALPPELYEGQNGNYLMPRDPQGGGSWMGVHCSGFFIALLNNYPGDKIIIDPSLRSRGMLVKELLEEGSFPDTTMLKNKTDKDVFAPFYLAAISRKNTRLWEWDQESISEISSEPGILSSSGYRHSYISTLRKELLAKQLPDPSSRSRQELMKFHTFEDHSDTTRGILMTRPEAMTVSISEIELAGNEARLVYHERHDIDSPLESRITLNCGSSNAP